MLGCFSRSSMLASCARSSASRNTAHFKPNPNPNRNPNPNPNPNPNLITESTIRPKTQTAAAVGFLPSSTGFDIFVDLFQSNLRPSEHALGHHAENEVGKLGSKLPYVHPRGELPCRPSRMHRDQVLLLSVHRCPGVCMRLRVCECVHVTTVLLYNSKTCSKMSFLFNLRKICMPVGREGAVLMSPLGVTPAYVLQSYILIFSPTHMGSS